MDKLFVQQRVLWKGGVLPLERIFLQKGEKVEDRIIAFCESDTDVQFSDVNECTININDYCIIRVGVGCIVKTSNYSAITTKDKCIVSTGIGSFVDVGDDCIVKSRSHCIVKAGKNGKFKAYGSTIFDVGHNSQIYREDTQEKIILPEGGKIKLNPYMVKGYIRCIDSKL